MLELFVVGTFWFWFLVIAEIIILFSCIEYESGGGATIAVLVGAALLQWCGNLDMLGYAAQHPWTVLSWTLGYFVIGTVWSIFKWWMFCNDLVQKLKEKRIGFLEYHKLPVDTKVIPEEYLKEWRSHIRSNADDIHREYHYGSCGYLKSVKAWDYRERILRWMSWWVVSVVWTVINDFVKRAFIRIYRKIANFLQKISDRAFASFYKEFPEDFADPKKDSK